MDPAALATTIWKQFATVRNEPIPFIASLVMMWFIMRHYFSDKFATRTHNAASNEAAPQARIINLEKTIADYKERLSGADPQEAQNRIIDLEAAIDKLQLRRRFLSEDQKNIIGNAIRPHPFVSGQLEIIYVQSSEEAASYACDFQDALAIGGWDVQPDTLISGQRIRQKGLVVATSGSREQVEIASIIEKALQKANLEFRQEVQSDRPHARLYVDMIA